MGLLLGCAGVDSDSGGPPPPPACQGLACLVPHCAAGTQTVVRGRVTAPNGIDPIGQAIVYVPQSGELTPLPMGLGCELCSDPVAGRAVTFTYSGLDGRFELSGVPAGPMFPLVVQKGRFRRLVQVAIAPCQTQELALDGGRLALPKSRSEGDLPQIAVAAGDHDAIECVLRDLGLDSAEFGGRMVRRRCIYTTTRLRGCRACRVSFAIPTLLGDRARLCATTWSF